MTLRQLTRYAIAGIVILALVLMVGGCGGDSMKLGEWARGDRLMARVVTLERVSEVAFQGDYTLPVEGENLRIQIVSIRRAPEVKYRIGDEYKTVHSEEGNELVLVDLDLFNKSDEMIPLSLDGESAELTGAGGARFYPVDPYAQAITVSPPSEGEDWTEVFLWGEVDLDKELYLSGTVIFEMPKGTAFKQFNWREGDELSIEFEHRVVYPKEEGNELVVAKMDVMNYGATKVFLSIEPDGVELGEKVSPYRDFQAVDPFEQSVEVEEPPEGEGEYAPLLWGTVELEKQFQISGWVIFEVPKGVKFRRAVWREGDSVYINF